MNVLLFSMPDVSPMFPPKAWRPPQIGIASLAANTTDHEVFCADLIARREDVRGAIREALDRVKPSFAGLSAMSFQYATALKVAACIKEFRPDLPLVLGGYHATVLGDEVTSTEPGRTLFDYVIRGEGETAFNGLVHAFAARSGFEKVAGLSWKKDNVWTHNERGPLEDLSKLKIPKRSARLWADECFLMGLQPSGKSGSLFAGILKQGFDVVESSRGCTMVCNFCSIQHMYGRSFRTYPLERVMADIADSKARGAKWIVFADDNITLDTDRFEALCDAIVAAGHDDLRYVVQASSAGVSARESVAAKMSRAGIRICFLGIESASERDLLRMKKGNIIEKTRQAVRWLHKHKILIVGGMVLGLPDDSPEDFERNYRFFRDLQIDFLGDQIATPYPRTGMREDYAKEGLITNPDDFRFYSGFWANVRTKHLSSDDIQFLRWKMRRRFHENEPLPPALRASLSVYALVRTLFYSPTRSLWRRLKRWNMSDRDLYEAAMERARKDNEFF